jgi:hypothetical protein
MEAFHNYELCAELQRRGRNDRQMAWHVPIRETGFNRTTVEQSRQLPFRSRSFSDHR